MEAGKVGAAWEVHQAQEGVGSDASACATLQPLPWPSSLALGTNHVAGTDPSRALRVAEACPGAREQVSPYLKEASGPQPPLQAAAGAPSHGCLGPTQAQSWQRDSLAAPETNPHRDKQHRGPLQVLPRLQKRRHRQDASRGRPWPEGGGQPQPFPCGDSDALCTAQYSDALSELGGKLPRTPPFFKTAWWGDWAWGHGGSIFGPASFFMTY